VQLKRLKVQAVYSTSWEPISELRGVTCHMGSHSVTCHLTQVNAYLITYFLYWKNWTYMFLRYFLSQMPGGCTGESYVPVICVLCNIRLLHQNVCLGSVKLVTPAKLGNSDTHNWIVFMEFWICFCDFWSLLIFNLVPFITFFLFCLFSFKG